VLLPVIALYGGIFRSEFTEATIVNLLVDGISKHRHTPYNAYSPNYNSPVPVQKYYAIQNYSTYYNLRSYPKDGSNYYCSIAKHKFSNIRSTPSFK